MTVDFHMIINMLMVVTLKTEVTMEVTVIYMGKRRKRKEKMKLMKNGQMGKFQALILINLVFQTEKTNTVLGQIHIFKPKQNSNPDPTVASTSPTSAPIPTKVT